MSQLTAIDGARRRHRRFRRWTVAEKTQYLEAFRRSGLSGEAFCRETGLPRATFAYWRREVRLTGTDDRSHVRRSRTTFARVAVVASAGAPPGPALEAGPGLRVLVRAAGGDEAALDGVDVRTAMQLVALVLGRQP